MVFQQKFAIIINEKDLPTPFLIALNRSTSPSEDAIKFFHPNMIYCPTSMSAILTYLKDKEKNGEYKKLVLNKMVNLLTCNRSNSVPDACANFWEKQTISEIIETLTTKYLRSQGPITRSESRKR